MTRSIFVLPGFWIALMSGLMYAWLFLESVLNGQWLGAIFMVFIFVICLLMLGGQK